ncbi:hypothetical protein PIB30_082141 [Stylosanthes scabra]|uniref:Ribonuclease H1 N-terminal domain-containing protein n=1 Tax=Stylosanthes scabra TaxID=79078 RepID=A0ABU6XR82_9FABA|nr:hypothetical protein [Stylosanthes scabra]
MEENTQRYLFYVVTKGHQPGVYSSWAEAKEQVEGFTFAEVHGFNSYEYAVLCFKSRMSSICSEIAATEDVFGCTWDVVSGSNGLPVIPEEELNAEFALVNSMEDWLVKLCHKCGIPGPCFFRQVRYLRNQGPFFGYTVVVPGFPLELELVATGRYSRLETAAREDAAAEMLRRLEETTGKEIRYYNHSKVKLYSDANNALRARVAQLEDAYDKLRVSRKPTRSLTNLVQKSSYANDIQTHPTRNRSAYIS